MKLLTTLPLRSLAVLILAAVGIWAGLEQTALAGPISGTATNPAVKTAVYQGVISIVQSTGGGVMEIGNLGKEINDTSDLYLRPQALAAGSAIQVTRDAASAKAYLKLLNNGYVCLGGSCKNQWDPAGSGASLWQTSGTQLIPITSTYGITAPGPSLYGAPNLDIWGSNSDSALYIKNSNNTSSAYALGIGGVTNIYGDLLVNGNVKRKTWVYNPMTGGYDPYMGTAWHAGNDGIGSGLDADSLDGVDLSYRRDDGSNPAECNGIAGTICVCSNSFGVNGCIPLHN